MPEYTGVITTPGLYPDIPEAEYHADPVPESEGGSLSVSGAKLLLEPSVPAKYDWARQHGRLPTKAQRLGTVTHGLVLGTGPEIAVLEFENRRTNKYKDAETAAIKAGKLPVLAHEFAEAREMADAILTHPTAAGLLKDADPEVSMFWQDAQSGIWLRGRADALSQQFGMPTIVDLKSSKDASYDAFAKSVHEYGYFRQDPWYREGWAQHLGCQWDEVDFIFIVVENEPPYLVATYRISDGTDGPDDVWLGREHNKIAREIYADCTAAGTWPAYSPEIETLPLRRNDRFAAERIINDWHR